MAVQPKRFCLFNCDETYDLKKVEEFLMEVDEKYKYKISVDSLYFGLRQMAEMVETTLPTLKMDFAIFVVYADENHLSFNEDNAGIGYARIYKALLQATDDKVLIVIGGDSYYKDEDEEDRSVISRWARRKVASQFNEEYLDGRKSFIFSWDTKHRPIHEEALRHYLDPSKKGVKFVYTPKPKPLPRPAEPEFIVIRQPASQDARQELTQSIRAQQRAVCPEVTGTRDKKNPTVQRGAKQSDAQEFTDGAIVTNRKSGTVLLSTVMRHGVISYKTEDVEIWEDDKKWRVSPKAAQQLEKDWKSVSTAPLKLVTDDHGVVQITVILKPEPGIVQRVYNSCSIS